MIEVKNVRKSFDRLEVLKGVSLSVNDGEIVSIVGPSGAGKSTLLQIMGSLDRPDTGEVSFNGNSIFKLSANEMAKFRNRNIGFVFQFHRLLPEFSLLENVAIPAMIGGESRREAMAKAEKLLKYLGLENRLEHRPAQLSGGECQRGAVARSLINNPEVVLADEPSGSLDTANRQELHKLFFDLRRDMNQTFVIVTHDESLAAAADRIIHLRDGQIEKITISTDGK
ncbi:MAG: ABC transporter ATP-binding protein [Muribaculaceae bacterium]|nr:ABC transporter ATP-binding protein [Muribaculaceae bacterium]